MGAEPTKKTPLSQVLPPLIFGTGTFNTQYNVDPYQLDTNGLVHQALLSGIRAFDTSPYYGPSEELLGAALATPEVQDTCARSDYYLLTKVGRITEFEFDYTRPAVRASVQRSLERLRTEYLDVVYCHDVEFVPIEAALGAIKELRKMRDKGIIRYVGISGYPVGYLCRIAERVKRETGEPLDVVMSYANYTLQNTTLATKGLERLKRAGVDVVPNAAPLGMGMLRKEGPPVGITDFHPSEEDLRGAVQLASDFCDTHDERLEVVAIRWALESWLHKGAEMGSLGDPASGSPARRETNQGLGGKKLGVSVMGFSNHVELDKTLRIWRSILDGQENGQQLADAAGRWKKDHEWSTNRRAAVELLAEGVREQLGSWIDFCWPSPPPGTVCLHKSRSGTTRDAPWPTPSGSRSGSNSSSSSSGSPPRKSSNANSPPPPSPIGLSPANSPRNAGSPIATD